MKSTRRSPLRPAAKKSKKLYCHAMLSVFLFSLTVSIYPIDQPLSLDCGPVPNSSCAKINNICMEASDNCQTPNDDSVQTTSNYAQADGDYVQDINDPPAATPAVPRDCVTEPVRVCLDVANIMQTPFLPNGCEVVSLAITLNYAGYPVDPVELYDAYMPKAPLQNGDPWTSYIGDAKGWGYGCYAPCVVTTGNAYLAAAGSSKTVSDVSGQDLSYYEHLIDNGIPVILWGTIGMNGNPRLCWEDTINGKYVNWHSYSHCLVLIGYTDDTYIFCDPLEGIVEYARSAVEASFSINYRQACIVA